MATSGERVVSAIDDHLSPYCLHSGDNPSCVLVSPLLDGSNYHGWSRSMEISLGAKNKLGFVNGTLSKPAATDTDLPLWNRCNLMIQSWIINSCTKEIAQCILYLQSAADMWRVLRERFSQGNAPRIFEIQKEIYSMQQEGLTVTVYFNKLDTLWNESHQFSPIPICTCSGCKCTAKKELADKEERNKALKFLMGLHDSYGAVRSQILLMDPLPPLNQIFNMVIQEERQRSIVNQSSNLESVALVTQGKNSKATDGAETMKSVQYSQS